MNREQRRNISKVLQKDGHSKEYIEQYLAIRDAMDLPTSLDEGTKVRLNVKRIMEPRSFEQKQTKYRRFVEDNQDNVFTVEYDKRYLGRPSLVCLAEDGSEVKWYWHTSDLIVVGDENETNKT